MATKEEFIEMMEPDEATRQKLNLLAAFVKSLDNTEIVKAQKDLEILKVQKDIEILKVQKDMKIAESQFCAEIKALEANVLKLSSACTSRGIFEFALKGVYSELGLKGTFNASAVCKVLIDCELPIVHP